MIENAEKFFDRYARDEELRRRVLEAEAMYPGSLEIREAVVEEVLLPIAADLGLPFTLKDLRAFETRHKLKNSPKADEPIREGEPIEDPVDYWLLDKGWSYDYEGAIQGE
ncbi:MAG: Nif11-like leader peptide family natural product precursor [Oscillospiraceae bacterium]|nr:Nif11-like leader peptide family natural product precursor [Oscillospiraceae bacterium]